jgi:hypothetical protein
MTALHPDDAQRGLIEGFPVRRPRTSGSGAPETPVLDGALDWLTEHLDWFDPARWERFLPRRPFPLGALLELLVLGRVLARGRLQEHPLLPAAADLAAAHVGAPTFLDATGRGDDTVPYRAYLVALVEHAGRPVPAARDRVQAVLEAGIGDHTGPWRPVQHRLELRYVLELGGFPVDGPSTAELVGASILTGAPDPLSMRSDEAYAVTHVVLYATDFGARQLPTAMPTELFRTLLGVALACGDLDLAGEFLLCLAPAGDDPFDAKAWRHLAAACRADGAVPGPVHDASRWAELSGDTAEAYLFGTCHHTTMVAAMAAAERERLLRPEVHR